MTKENSVNLFCSNLSMDGFNYSLYNWRYIKTVYNWYCSGQTWKNKPTGKFYFTLAVWCTIKIVKINVVAIFIVHHTARSGHYSTN